MALYLGERIGIQPSMLTITPVFEREDRGHGKVSLNSLANLEKKRSNNALSKKSDRKIRCAINWLLHSAYWKPVWKKSTGSIFYFKLNFVTLTLNSFYRDTPDNEIKEKLLQPFLSYARQYWHLFNYIWKIERTEVGTIHIHFTGDTFIPWRRLQKQWNSICRKQGFHSCYADKGDDYEPNSIDIHAINNHDNLAAELCKYLAKSDLQGKKIEGRLWGCSYSLSKAHGTKLIAERGTQFYDMVLALIDKLPNKFIEITHKLTGLKKTIGVLLFPSPRDWIDNSMGQLKFVYEDVIQMLRSGLEPLTQTPFIAE